MFQYNKEFERYYREWFSNMPLATILEYENNLSTFLDSGLYDNFVLADEVNLLYEIIRDECVKRCRLGLGVYDK